jgi:hypothetical protein
LGPEKYEKYFLIILSSMKFIKFKDNKMNKYMEKYREFGGYESNVSMM